ncbi:MAG: SMP-30/gluconolactonase/LRE family protein [Actinomycetota bacterium]
MANPEITEITDGLRFPEGPVARPDGSVIVVELAAGTITRVAPDGTKSTVAEPGGSPNGAAIGPDGAVWITNNGACFTWIEFGDLLLPGPTAEDWEGGCIQRVDPSSARVDTVYTHSSGRPLRAPNDLVFDGHGGFWFTDHGVRRGRTSDRTGVHYALVDGSDCREVLFPLDAPNGVGLSPGGDRLYVAETHTGRLWAWDVPEPGVATGGGLLEPHGELLAGLPGAQLLDSLAVDAAGNVCVGTLQHGGITVVAPDGSSVEHVPLDDPLVTNLAFGGADLRTVYVTASATGRLLAGEWPRPGLRPAHG